MRFVWKYLPVFIVWLTGIRMTDITLHQFVPSVSYAGWLGLAPLCIVLVLLGFVLQRECGKLPIKRYLLWISVLIGISIIPFIPREFRPLSLDTNRFIYEMSAIIVFIILIIHGRTWLKRKDWAWIFALTMAYGIILENGGILMGFFREDGYLIYLPFLPAPVATVIGWVSVLYCAYFIVEKVLPVMRPIFRGLVVTGIGLALDISFDPVATAMGWWTWNNTLRMSIWGVPVVNYVAWFWALFPYSWCYYRVRGEVRISEKKKLALNFLLLPAILAVDMCGVVISLLIIGNPGALKIIEDFFKGIL
jgi:uncharacterized membrane protein